MNDRSQSPPVAISVEELRQCARYANDGESDHPLMMAAADEIEHLRKRFSEAQAALDAINGLEHVKLYMAASAYAVQLREALDIAVSLVHIPEHAWDTEEDAQLAKCVAVLAQAENNQFR